MSQKLIVMARQTPPDHDYAFSMFAVRPESQGKGVGGGVMRQLFAERLQPLAATGATVRVSLMSQMERNLSLYLRQGFVVIDDERLTSEED